MLGNDLQLCKVKSNNVQISLNMAQETIKSRIDYALKMKDLGRTDLASKLDISRGAVSDMLNSEGDPPMKYVHAAAELTGFLFEWLSTGKGPLTTEQLKVYNEINISNEPASEYLKGKKARIITVTVDQSGKDLMVYVPVKAQAGYLRGHGDPHYIEKLPAFSLPILRSGQYRMFEVDGESMLQIGGGGLHDGDIVISQYVEDIFSLRDNRVYVVISTDGVCVKRCINRLKEKENPVLILKSDNKNGSYPDIILRPHEIIEAWELKAFISKQLGFAVDIWKLVTDIEAKVALLDEKVNKISDERLLPG